MEREEFKNVLHKYNYSYYEHNVWLIIDNKNYGIYLNRENIVCFPDYLIFDNKGAVSLTYNNLKEFPKNIIFTKNVKELNTSLESLEFKYYGNFFSKIIRLYINDLNDNLRFEKLINMYIELYDIIIFDNNFDISNQYKTPHICLTKVLEDNNNKEYINIKLPKNFLSISSWI